MDVCVTPNGHNEYIHQLKAGDVFETPESTYLLLENSYDIEKDELMCFNLEKNQIEHLYKYTSAFVPESVILK